MTLHWRCNGTYANENQKRNATLFRRATSVGKLQCGDLTDIFGKTTRLRVDSPRLLFVRLA